MTRLAVCAGMLAALVLPPGGAAGASMPRAKSLGPAPVKCVFPNNKPTCMYDLWGKDFIVRLEPHIVHVGERIGISVKPHFDDSWYWSVPSYWKPLTPCKPKPGALMPGKEQGGCTWLLPRTTNLDPAFLERWQYAGAQANTCGACNEMDYYAVLPAGEHQLSGYVRTSAGAAVKSARVEFTQKSTGATSYTVSGAGGYYSALLVQGTYDVRTTGARAARVWLQGNRAVDFTRP